MTDRAQAIAGLKYAAPKLEVYGGMAGLTASGAAGSRENNPPNGKPQKKA